MIITEYIAANYAAYTKPIYLAGDLNTSKLPTAALESWKIISTSANTFVNTSSPSRIDYVLVYTGNSPSYEVLHRRALAMRSTMTVSDHFSGTGRDFKSKAIMKNRLLNSFFRAAAFALLLAAGACKDDAALPMQRVALNTHAILAPSFATTLSFDVEANCDWTISVAGDDTSWAELSQTEATGMATVAVSIAENNTSGSRALTIRVAAKRNAAVVEELSFVQASATAEGYLSIPDLRKLAADGDYSVTQDVKMRGIVVSSVQDNNYYDNCIALQSALKANCGITLRTDEVLYRKPGEELEIDLKGAVVGVNPETGVMEVKPAADDKVSRTETTQVTPAAVPVSSAQLASGDYESMYVALDVQVVVSDLNKLLSDNVTVQTVDDERFVLCARQASTFGIDAVPVGSGRLCGIAGIYEGAYAVMPCTGSDITMSSPRFDGGITLPYVLSIMTKTATNGDGRYIFYSGTNGTGSIEGVAATAMDGTGANITARLSSSGGNLGFRYWNRPRPPQPADEVVDGRQRQGLRTFHLPAQRDDRRCVPLLLRMERIRIGPRKLVLELLERQCHLAYARPDGRTSFRHPAGKVRGRWKELLLLDDRHCTANSARTSRDALYPCFALRRNPCGPQRRSHRQWRRNPPPFVRGRGEGARFQYAKTGRSHLFRAV